MQSDIPDSIPLLRKRFLYGVLFFTIAGSLLALYAAFLTFKLTVSGITDPSGCSFNDWLSCDTVLSTGSAKLFGVPVAWWGFLYYVWAFFATLFALINSRKTSGTASAEAVLFISSISVAITFIKIYQLISLGVICPVCVGMYICNFVILIFLMRTLNISLKRLDNFFINYLRSIFSKGNESKDSPHPIRFGVIFIWLFAMGFLGLKYYENRFIEPGLPDVKMILTEHYKQNPFKINTEGAPVTGNSGSKISIVEFSDFECPACKLLSSNVNSMLLEYKDDAGFYFMNYPLDSSINVNLHKELHKNAGLAAIAGICANEQGKFWEYQNKLFENQTKLSRDFLIETAADLGLDKNKFTSCIDSEEAKLKVIHDIETAHSLGINGTPTVFINGRKVKYWNSPVVLKAIIDEEIKSMSNEQ